MPEETTLNDVLLAIKQQGAEMNARFEKTDARFKQQSEEMNARFKQQDERFDESMAAINEFASHTETEFDNIKGRLGKVETTTEQTQTDLVKMRSEMVTKDYLDDKLADLRGDLVVMTRKEDTKLKTLVEILQKRHVITQEDATKINTMEPFPVLAL